MLQDRQIDWQCVQHNVLLAAEGMQMAGSLICSFNGDHCELCSRENDSPENACVLLFFKQYSMRERCGETHKKNSVLG